MRTRVKFCGMTRPGDVRLAAELGVDAVGLVFASGSPRAVDIEQGRRLREAAPPMLSIVALLMDAPRSLVEAVIHEVRPDLLQFHGSEDDAFCASFGHPYVKALGMAGLDAAQAASRLRAYPKASALLLDGHRAGQAGGQGERFDWAQVPAMGHPLWLAGGLSEDNVAQAIAQARPQLVDVSSGIESAPGIKDGHRMQAFLQAVAMSDHARQARGH